LNSQSLFSECIHVEEGVSSQLGDDEERGIENGRGREKQDKKT